MTTDGPPASGPHRSHRAALADGRWALLASWCALVTALTGFMLFLVPLYAGLQRIPDHGGALGKPSLAETPGGSLQLRTWPFNQYAIEPSDWPAAAVEVQVLIGDYVLLLKDGPEGRSAGLRVSVDPRIPSAFVNFAGDGAESVEPLPALVVAASSPHRLAASSDGARLTFLVDGREAVSAPSGELHGQWRLVTGIRPTTILQTGSGPAPGSLRHHDPWLYKALWLAPLAGMLLLAFPRIFGGWRAEQRWLGCVILVLAALSLTIRSAYVILSLLAVVTGGLAFSSGLLLRVSAAVVLRRSPGRELKRLAALALLVGPWMAFFLGLGAPAPHTGPQLPRMEGVPAHRVTDGTGATARPRVLVFGASTVVGEGLANPAGERFVELLSPGPSGQVETWAVDAGMMKDMLRMETEALRQPADVVVLYLTFNEAMNPSGGSLFDSLFSLKGIRMLQHYFDSSRWMSDHYAVKGPLYESMVDTFVVRAQQAGARVLLVGEPCADYILYADMGHGIVKYHELLRTIARRHGAAYIDFSSDLLSRRDDLVFVDAVHLSALGHRLLAARLNAALAPTPDLEPLR
jgi:lysophospholipase L1-like esterase